MGAAYLVNGGCSDDGFDSFRGWLLLQGRKVYEAALDDPDSLAAHLKGHAEVEADCLPGYDAYRAVTGRDDYFEALKARHPDLPDYPPLGPGGDFDDEARMRKRYPRLYQQYLADDA